MHVYYDTIAISPIDTAIQKYKMKEFASPTRSTVPLLSWLKREPQMLKSLLEELKIPDDRSLHLEYRVMPPLGRGKASHTDLMVISQGHALAIEAKWTEPRYESVNTWLNKEKDGNNREEVITGWLRLLEKHSQRPLRREDFSDAIYQMVHRAASACHCGDNPRMAYVVFEPSPAPRTAGIQTIAEDLTHLWSLIGSSVGFPFYLIEVPLVPTDAYDVIKGLPKGQPETAVKVKEALLGERPLFTFGDYRLTRIGGPS